MTFFREQSIGTNKEIEKFHETCYMHPEQYHGNLSDAYMKMFSFFSRTYRHFCVDIVWKSRNNETLEKKNTYLNVIKISYKKNFIYFFNVKLNGFRKYIFVYVFTILTYTMLI